MNRFIESYDGREYDVIIIGGGISGAAVAYDAASRGLSVALVEKSDFGSATSAATSKLIHGGLRYLSTMEVGLVRESLRERRILENIAPNFVYPIPFLFPTNTDRLSQRRWFVKVGMIMYDILSFDKGWTWDKSKRIPYHFTLSSRRVLELEPNVKRKNLTGAVVYYDCLSICPERLTLAFIKSAVKYGAHVANYAKVEGFLFQNTTRIAGVAVRDLLTGKTHEIRGKLTINCGGPWADLILNLAHKQPPDEKLRRSEGIHIITKKLTNSHVVVGTSSKENGHFFIIPWREHSLIGVTDKEYVGNPDDYRVTKTSILELIDRVNENFGRFEHIRYEDVLFAYGGLRPLVEKQTKDVYHSSRKYEIYDNAKDGLENLITVEGGKYTTSRNLAAQVMKIVAKKIRKPMKPLITHKQYLVGCEITDIESYVEKAIEENRDFSPKTIDYLARMYGTELPKVLAIARSDKKLAKPLNHDGEMLAQVVYAVRNEMAKTLRDIVLRRTGIGTLGNPGDEVLSQVALTASKELKWSKERIARELKETKKALEVPKN